MHFVFPSAQARFKKGAPFFSPRLRKGGCGEFQMTVNYRGKRANESTLERAYESGSEQLRSTDY